MANHNLFIKVASRVAKSKAKFFTPGEAPGLDEEGDLPSDDELIEEAFDAPGDEESEITYGGDSGTSDMIDFDMGVDSDGLEIPTEYSCHIQIDLTATFEGTVSKADLIGRIKEHLKVALKTGMQKAAGEMSLRSTDVKVMPIQMDVAVLDGSEMGLEYPSPSGESDEYFADEQGTDHGDDSSEGADYDTGSDVADEGDEYEDEGSSAASEAADSSSAAAEED